ncbi:hypothetical protein PRIC1_009462 [Phytophthora ramorum]
MAGRKRSTPPRPNKQQVVVNEEDDNDNVPLATILQRRRAAISTAAMSKQKNGASATRRRKTRVVPPLCEVGERCIMEFLPVVPDRLRAEAVCKRWRRMSQQDVPVTDLDFGQVAVRPLLRRDISAMLERANQKLTRLVLPDAPLFDAHVELIMQQRSLRVFRAHRMQKKHIFNILKRCRRLESLELLDCRALTLSGWPRDAVQLREVFLNGCNFVTNQAASSLIKVCGGTLEKIIFTEAMSMDSHIFKDVARHSVKLEELTVSNSSSIQLSDLQTLTEALWGSLRWIDLSSCRGLSSFPSSANLPHLEVLILDKTKINDDGLRALSQVAPSLRYLSLQDCRAISDDGVTAIASSDGSEGCTNLELVDLKGTPVTDTSLEALEAQCPRLHLVRVDSCRLSKCERIYAERKKIEMIDSSKSDSETNDDSESDQDADGDYVIQVRRAAASYRRRRR